MKDDGLKMRKSPPEEGSYAASTGESTIHDKSNMPGYQGLLGSSVTPESDTVSTMSSSTLRQQSASASNHGGTSNNLASKGATPALRSSKYSTPQ